MSDPDSIDRAARWRRASAPVALAAAAFLLAYLSPLEDVAADPAIALLASQAFLDHGTWRLDPYDGEPGLAYDLEDDYRIRRQDGDYAYYGLGVPVLSLPSVWLANRFGYHMLDQEHEFALQNLLSALCCALLAVLLYRLCRTYLAPVPSLVLAAVAVFGSSLMSTLATGLWNLDYAVVLLAAALLYLVRRDPEGVPGARRWPVPALLAAAAFACRPTAGFAIAAAVLAFGVLEGRRRVWRWVIVAGGLAVAVLGLWALGAVPEGLYYTPRKLLPRTPPWVGLYGTLLSPSRGLLVFSPFLMVVIGVAVARWRRLWPHPWFRFAALWIGFHVLAVSVKETWWGGHSYGPRLLTEAMVPLTLVACLVWRDLAGVRRPVRRGLAAAFLVLGVAAVAIHSIQGLFNPAVQRWNSPPLIDRYPELVFDWRTPQFLASEESLAARLERHQRRTLEPYRFGDDIGPDSQTALFRDWYPSEGTWRWSRGTSPEVVLMLDPIERERTHLLALNAGTNGFQTVAVRINGNPVGRFVGRSFEPARQLFAFPGSLLAAGSDNVIRFAVPGAAPAGDDPRVLGLALHSLRLFPLPPDFAVGHGDDVFFAGGWSDAEAGWRWSDGDRAAVLYPVGEVTAEDAVLELHAGTLGEQRVRLAIDGAAVGELRFDGLAPQSRRLTFAAGILRSGAVHRLELELPDARRPEGDARRLGVSLVYLTIRAE